MEHKITHINFLPKAPPLSLYVHFPWCEQKCPYCDFNSYSLHSATLPLSWQKRYLSALKKDLEQSLSEIYGRKINSIFFGGGTPSLFVPEILDDWLSHCRALLGLHPELEITLEANPGSSEKSRFAEYKALGISRLSIGIQSFSDKHLQALGRVHSQKESLAALEAAKHVAFPEINADLMYGLPEQTFAEAEADLALLLTFDLNHLSYYQLTIEPNTAFFHKPPPLPDQDWQATWEDRALEKLGNAGYQRYEVSAFANSAASECQHNRNYWEYGDYLGIGAGAHSKLSLGGKILRRQRLRQPEQYIQSLERDASGVLEEKIVLREERAFEFMLNALRLKNGFRQDLFYQRTGLPWSQVAATMDQLIAQGLLIADNQYFKTTDLGFRFLNQVTRAFLPKGDHQN
jgi:oxygen-independent coproporphyrinogen-3 oxidase